MLPLTDSKRFEPMLSGRPYWFASEFAFGRWILDFILVAGPPVSGRRRRGVVRFNAKSSPSRAAFEALESRQLLSGVSLTITPLNVSGGVQLQILGTPGNDQITVDQTADGLVVGNAGGWTQTFPDLIASIRIDGGAGNDSILLTPAVTQNATLFGGAGNDTLAGGSGDDALYAGPGNNILNGGDGNDTLVCLGSTRDTLSGGNGRDRFWTDNTTAEKVTDLTRDEGGDLHRVGNINISGAASTKKVSSATIAKQLNTSSLSEPLVDNSSFTYRDFSGNVLFSAAGPSPDDVNQGDIGDCYFLAALSAVAKSDAWRLRQIILDLGDGTYLVQMSHRGASVFERVDARLPVTQSGYLAYAGLGEQGSLWAALMEKAWCAVRSSANSYASIDSGWMDEAFGALGASSTGIYSAANGQALLTLIQKQLAAGKAVTFATNVAPDDSPLLSGHAYEVDSVNLDANGVPVSMRLRNPWGVDGAGNDGNDDGYVTITAAQAMNSFLGMVSAYV